MVLRRHSVVCETEKLCNQQFHEEKGYTSNTTIRNTLFLRNPPWLATSIRLLTCLNCTKLRWSALQSSYKLPINSAFLYINSFDPTTRVCGTAPHLCWFFQDWNLVYDTNIIILLWVMSFGLIQHGAARDGQTRDRNNVWVWIGGIIRVHIPICYATPLMWSFRTILYYLFGSWSS